MSTKNNQLRMTAISAAYEKMGDDDKIQVDLAVKALLDHYATRNAARANRAKFQFSRDNALELVASLGLKFGGMEWPAEDETK